MARRKKQKDNRVLCAGRQKPIHQDDFGGVDKKGFWHVLEHGFKEGDPK